VEPGGALYVIVLHFLNIIVNSLPWLYCHHHHYHHTSCAACSAAKYDDDDAFFLTLLLIVYHGYIGVLPSECVFACRVEYVCMYVCVYVCMCLCVGVHYFFAFENILIIIVIIIINTNIFICSCGRGLALSGDGQTIAFGCPVMMMMHSFVCCSEILSCLSFYPCCCFGQSRTCVYSYINVYNDVYMHV